MSDDFLDRLLDRALGNFDHIRPRMTPFGDDNDDTWLEPDDDPKPFAGGAERRPPRPTAGDDAPSPDSAADASPAWDGPAGPFEGAGPSGGAPESAAAEAAREEMSAGRRQSRTALPATSASLLTGAANHNEHEKLELVRQETRAFLDSGATQGNTPGEPGREPTGARPNAALPDAPSSSAPSSNASSSSDAIPGDGASDDAIVPRSLAAATRSRSSHSSIADQTMSTGAVAPMDPPKSRHLTEATFPDYGSAAYAAVLSTDTPTSSAPLQPATDSRMPLRRMTDPATKTRDIDAVTTTEATEVAELMRPNPSHATTNAPAAKTDPLPHAPNPVAGRAAVHPQASRHRDDMADNSSGAMASAATLSDDSPANAASVQQPIAELGKRLLRTTGTAAAIESAGTTAATEPTRSPMIRTATGHSPVPKAEPRPLRFDHETVQPEPPTPIAEAMVPLDVDATIADAGPPVSTSAPVALDVPAPVDEASIEPAPIDRIRPNRRMVSPTSVHARTQPLASGPDRSAPAPPATTPQAPLLLGRQPSEVTSGAVDGAAVRAAGPPPLLPSALPTAGATPPMIARPPIIPTGPAGPALAAPTPAPPPLAAPAPARPPIASAPTAEPSSVPAPSPLTPAPPSMGDPGRGTHPPDRVLEFSDRNGATASEHQARSSEARLSTPVDRVTTAAQIEVPLASDRSEGMAEAGPDRRRALQPGTGQRGAHQPGLAGEVSPTQRPRTNASTVPTIRDTSRRQGRGADGGDVRPFSRTPTSQRSHEAPRSHRTDRSHAAHDAAEPRRSNDPGAPPGLAARGKRHLAVPHGGRRRPRIGLREFLGGRRA